MNNIQDPPYRKKVYDILSSGFSDFKTTEQDFYNKLDSDPEYAGKVFDVISSNFSDFKRPKNEFLDFVKKKDGTIDLGQQGLQSTPPKIEDTTPSLSSLIRERKNFLSQGISRPSETPYYNQKLGEIDKIITSKGYVPDELTSEFSDIDIDFSDQQIADYFQQKKIKPLTTSRVMAHKKWKEILSKYASQESDPQKKSELEGVINNLAYSSGRLPDNNYQYAIDFGKNAINTISSIASGDDRAKAIEAFKTDFIPVLGNILLRDKNAINAIGDRKNVPQELALTVADLFDKPYADQTRAVISAQFDSGSDNGYWTSPEQRGKQYRLFELENGGIGYLNDALNEEYEKNYDRIKQFDDWVKQNVPKLEELDKKIKSGQYGEDDVLQYNQLVEQYKSFDDADKVKKSISGWTNLLSEKKSSQNKRYPAIESDNLIKLQQEWGGENVGPIPRFIGNIASFADKTFDALEIAYDAIISSPEQKLRNDFARIGRSKQSSVLFNYERENERLYQSPFSTVFSDKIKSELNSVDSDPNIPDDEKDGVKFSILKSGLEDGSIYQTTNPNYGKINLTGKSVINTITTLIPQVLTAAGISYISGGGAASLFTGAALQGYSDYYNDAVEMGYGNPNQYATAHAIVDATTELIGTTDLKILKDIFSNKTGFAAKFFREISDGEFQSLLSGSKGTFRNYGRAAFNNIKSNLEEAGEEWLAAKGSSFIDKALFNKEVPVEDGANEAFVSTVIGQLPLTLIGIPSSVRKNNIGSKYALYNAASDLNNTLSILKSEYDNGVITKDQYDQRVKLITDYSKALRESPDTYTNGKPMRDDDRALYVFNQFISNMRSDKTPLPPQQKEIVNNEIDLADQENDNILLETRKTIQDATQESAIQEGLQQGSVVQPTGVEEGQPEVGQAEGAGRQATQPEANVGDRSVSGEGQVAPGKRLFNEPNPEATIVEREFKASRGINTPEPAPITKLDENISKTIADAYDQLVDSPNDPEVQAAYQAMADETMDQFDAIDKAGVKVEIWTGKGEPYKNSAEMIADVRDNKHMYIYSTEEGFGDTPITEEQRQQNALLRDSGVKDINGRPLLINDIFRFVHDYFGHTKLGNSFGAIGEENAWNVHARMYSPLARRAMTTETRGQNSWVNFNKNLRNPDGSIKKKGDEGYIPPAQRPFAEQKMALLPEEFSQIEDEYSVKEEPVKEVSPIEQALTRALERVSNSLKKLGLKYVIVDPETDTEEAAAARGNQGLFRSSDGTIIIDKSKLANEIEAGLVVWHEAAHPVMNIIRNTDKPLYDAVVRGLEGAARQNTGIARAINWAQKNYSKNALSESQGRNVSAREAVEVQNDEAIVEIIARINEGIIDINTIEPGFLQKIIDFINSVAAAIGIDPIIDPTDIEQFKRTVSAVSSALKDGRDIAEVVGEENVKEYGSPIGEDAQARANEVFDGILEKIGIQIGKPNVKTGKTKVTNFDVAKAMNDYYKKLFKTTKVDDFSNKALETVSDYATDEVIFGINRFGNSSGKGWYTVDYSKALEIMKSFDPDIVDNPDIKEVATVVIAISSNSTDVYTNLTRIIYAIDQFKKTGKVPTDVGVGKGMSAIASSVSVYNNLLDLFGSVSELKDFMQTVRTVSDAKKALIEKSGAKSWAQVKERGLGTDPEWNETEVLPTSVILFGPKIGAFYSNLSGLGGTPTIDRWCIRTMYRYRGDMRAKALPSEINDFIKTNKLDGQSKGSVMSIIQDHSKMFDAILKGSGEFKGQTKEQRNERLKPYRKGSQIWKKMSGVVNEIEDGLTESIKNKAQYAKDFRSFTKKSFERVQQKVKEKIGEDLSISDIQAILWIYEKELFGALGVKQRPESTYSASAQRLLNEMNSGKFTIDQMKSGNVTGETDVTEEGSMGDSYGFDSKTFENGISNQPKRLNDQASVGGREIESIIEESKANGNYMKAPNGNPTRLTEGQWAQVRTKNFKNWFGDWENDPANSSKIVDDNGEPMVYYHGTSKDVDFNKFNVNKNGSWFTDNPQKASGYADQNDSQITEYDYSTGKYIDKNVKPRVFPVFLNIRRPEFFNQMVTSEQRDKIIYADNYKKYQSLYFQDIYYRKPLGERTDGLYYTDDKSVVVVLESPNQIKSATGNVGTFSTTQSSIKASVGNREEDILRRKPTGPERKRAMAERIEGQPAETVSKINKDALTYFQQTNKQTEDQVREFMKGKDMESLADYVVSDPQIPDVSLVWMAATVAKELKPMIEAARETNPDLARRLSEKQAAIYNQFAVKATELGQAVQAFVAFKGDKDATQFYLNKIISKLVNDYKIDVTDEQIAEIESRLNLVSEAKDGRPKNEAMFELGRYLNSIVPIKAIDILEATWYAKILSGVTTQATNAFANIFNTSFEVPLVALRESIRTNSIKPALYALKGSASGFVKGSVKAADIIKSGVREQDMNKYFGNNVLEYFSWGRTKVGKLAGGRVGKFLDLPVFIEWSPRALKYVGRGLAAVDAMFSSVNQDAYANMLAWSMAAEEKKTDPTVNEYNRANEILGNAKDTIDKAKQDAKDEGLYPGTVAYKSRVIELVDQSRPKDIERMAEEFGKKVTLNYEPEGFTKPMYDAIVAAQRKFRVLKLFIPFTRILSNLTEQMVNYSPLSYYRVITGQKNPLNKEKGSLTNQERADLAIRATTGMAAMAILAMKTGEDDDDWFEITANGTDNIQKNYELEKEGWRPFTITFKNGVKMSYANWPIRGVLSAIGNYRDALKYDQAEDTWSNRITISTFGALSTMYDGSLMKGLSEFMDAVQPDKGGGYGDAPNNVAKWSIQQAKSVVLSNFTQQMLKFTDEYQGDPIKEAKGIAIIYRDIPVLNDGLNPIIDVFGDPVIAKTSERLSMWYSVDDDRKDAIISELHKKGVFVGIPKKPNIIDIANSTERPMNDEEYYRFRLVYGQLLKYDLYKNIEAIQQASPDDLSDAMSIIKKGISKAAKESVILGMKPEEAISMYIKNDKEKIKNP